MATTAVAAAAMTSIARGGDGPDDPKGRGADAALAMIVLSSAVRTIETSMPSFLTSIVASAVTAGEPPSSLAGMPSMVAVVVVP